MHHGASPLTSPQDEITRVVNEITELVNHRVPLEHILVIHTTWPGREQVLERLRGRFGARAADDPKDTPRGPHIRVGTLNAVTGLESAVVFVLGTHRLWEAEGSLRLGEEERAELVRDNTRRLYMAMTRAGQRLVLTFVGALPAVLEELRRVGAVAG